MILGPRELLRRLNRSGQSRLVITPRPDEEALRKEGAASIDLRLGTWFMTPRLTKTSVLSVSKVSTGQEADPQVMKRHYVPFGKEFILHPRNFVLGVTLEWIRMPPDLAGYILGRSSWGRRGLIIATAAGVHPGFTGCLTLELTNVGEVPIEVCPAMAVSQLFLHKVQGSGRDASPFGGMSRPALGTIHVDPLTAALAADRL